jgi:hypothetical protein
MLTLSNQIKKTITIICKPMVTDIRIRTMHKVSSKLKANVFADTFRKVYPDKYIRLYPKKLTFKRLHEINSKKLILANPLQQQVTSTFVSTYNTFMSLPSSANTSMSLPSSYNKYINASVPPLLSQERNKIVYESICYELHQNIILICQSLWSHRDHNAVVVKATKIIYPNPSGNCTINIPQEPSEKLLYIIG